jgi:hypothetical protein
MRISKQKKTITVVASLSLLAVLFVWSTHSATVDFNAEVKPILNKKCISCHGGVKQQGGFSLLFRSEALAKTESGRFAIIPGDPANSEMIRRLHLKDPEERMPYKREPLSDAEIDVLRRWIKQGAQWGDHWAYVAVKEVPVPKESTSLFGFGKAENEDWARSDIDHFILDKLKQKGLKPAAEADKATLLRRVSLDLTGLPPMQALAQTFLNTHAANAYEVLVDSLLASPHFGERWAAVWMDLARYADTKGYERDDNRQIWKYRDWLINAYNSDMPYNQFLTEQLAGDLLERPTDEQLVATAFHRNTMTNDEGGTDNEEFRTAAVIDRVNSTWEGVLGTTFACVQCHSHPYDPFRHEDYYKFMAFFNNTRDEDTWKDYPLLRHHKGEDSLKVYKIEDWLSKNGYPDDGKAAVKFLKTWQPVLYSLRTDSFSNCELVDTKWLAFRKGASARLKSVDLTGKNELLFRYQGYLPGGVWTIHLDDLNGPVLKTIFIKPTRGQEWAFEKVAFSPQSGVHDLYFTYSNPALKNPLQNGVMFDWFYFTKSLPGKGIQGYDSVAHWYWDLATKIVEPTTPIMQENPPDMFRPTQVFERGNWLTKGAAVEADVPQALHSFPNKAPRNRLGLAQWITDVRNPLTARTMVNRLWEQLWGTGLVETLEDMGTQGAEPTHRELLDYLAYRFMHEQSWSIKKALREMVLSATYRQSSKVSNEALQQDPYNKWYARGARVRLSAEQVRDQALAYAGLLSEKLGGPSVMPWQPDGIWMSPWNGAYWNKSKGEDQYRRALYTFWKRTAPYPSLITFDGVGREVCVARRIRTNTPLQALVTLNDSVYLEAARHLAYRMQFQKSSGKDVAAQIQNGYERMFYKPINPNKLQALEKLYLTAYKTYQKDKEKQCEMIGVNDEHNTPETAALIVVANAMLNLDETVTKN